MLRRTACLLFAAALATLPGQASEAGEPAAEETLSASENPAAPRLDLAARPERGFAREHAPLALFSLGSVAVGGLFYGINASLEGGSRQVSGNGTRMGMAVGAAGISALAAGLSYLYYTYRGVEASPDDWSGPVSGGLAPDGSLAASIRLPIAALAE